MLKLCGALFRLFRPKQKRKRFVVDETWLSGPEMIARLDAQADALTQERVEASYTAYINDLLDLDKSKVFQMQKEVEEFNLRSELFYDQVILKHGKVVRERIRKS